MPEIVTDDGLDLADSTVQLREDGSWVEVDQ